MALLHSICSILLCVEARGPGESSAFGHIPMDVPHEVSRSPTQSFVLVVNWIVGEK